MGLVKTRVCTRCRRRRSVDDFHRYDRGRDGRRAECKFCIRSRQRKVPTEAGQRRHQQRLEATRRWRKRNPGKVAEGKRLWEVTHPVQAAASRRRRAMRRKYGIEPEDWDRMYEEQGGLCAICRTREANRVDHDHDTGVVRGLLCHRCNTRLSGLEDREWRVKALRYLKERAMGLVKHGAGEILPEDGDSQKTAAANWSEDDEQELAEELAEDDS